MKISNCERAVVDLQKLRDYCLSPDHLRGRHKAHVFASALGLSADDAELLRATILVAACNDEAVSSEQDEYGQRYTLDFKMTANEKEAVVRTAWIIRQGEDFPCLTSCYVV